MIDRLVSAFFSWDAKTWIALSFVPIAWMFVWALWRADRGSSSTFKFVHFVTNDAGRGSMYALGYTTLVVVCAWGVWALILLDKLTEWYMTVVCGVFILGALGGTAARIAAKINGAAESNAAAGDSDAPAPPAIERTTRTDEVVRIPQPDPPAKAKPARGKR